MKSRFSSLQALRALAFIGIFLYHAGSPIFWSSLGVSVFFVMSGFLMIYNYSDKQMCINLLDNIKFSICKINKLYDLHIITMLSTILIVIWSLLRSAETSLCSFINLATQIFLNVFLIQTWVPHADTGVSLNGVAWFLSVMMFLYMIFPSILIFIRNHNVKYLAITCSLIIISQIFSCFLLLQVFDVNSQFYTWFMYLFPVFRFGDFYIGCCLGKYILTKRFRGGICFDILVILLTTFVFYFKYLKSNSLLYLAIYNWTSLWIVLSVLWLLSGLNKKGVIIHILNNKLLIELGNITSYAFLIHFVVINYFNAIISYFCISYSDLPIIIKLLIIVSKFVITLILCYIYKKCRKNYISIGWKKCNRCR